MKNYGIELEFFVKNDKGIFIPAFKATSNLDGNPVIGEIRTQVHNDWTNCIFELKKLLYLETKELKEKGFVLELIDNIKVDDEFLKSLRKSESYINNKDLEILEELS